jgi:hypothetical protein
MEAMLESLCIAILMSTSKMLCLSYYFLYLLFNKIGEEGRTDSAWNREGWGKRSGWGAGGRNDPNNVYTYEYMNKEKKTEKGHELLEKK